MGRRLAANGVRRTFAGVAFFSLLYAGQANAQTQTFQLDRAQISGAPDDGFMVFRPQMHEETRFYANGALGFSLNPLRKDALSNDPSVRNEMEDPIQGQFGVYPSVGMELFGRFGFNMMLPFVPYQFTGADPVSAGIGAGGLTGTHSTFGDIRFDGRVKLWESNDRKTRLGVVAGFTVGTGTSTGFGGDRSATGLLFVSGEHDFGNFFITGHLGPHARPTRGISGSDLDVGSELRYAFGLFVPMRDGRLRLGAELWGSTGIAAPNGNNTFFTKTNTTFEWLAQARFLLDQSKRFYADAGGGTRLSAGYGSADFRILGSVGMYWTMNDLEPQAPPPKVITESRPDFYDEDTDKDGYPDSIDACPDVVEDKKAPDTSDGCPAPADADGDGIPDAKDKCPNEKEDFDGLSDKDGCPDPDVDNDAVKDEDDACPEEPGPPNAQKDVNGCPTLTKVTEDGKVMILKPIEFERGKAKIQGQSFPILDEVVLLMKSRPELKVAVYGHTDNKGSEAYNTQLSGERAAAVVKYLDDHGIDKGRLSSQGFGPAKPIDTNDTEVGRARNRRVEFVIQGEPSGSDAWKE